jgi:DNA polymerase-3 subunit delta'
MLKIGFNEDIDKAIKSLNTTKRALSRGIRLSLWIIAILSPIIDEQF